MDFAIPDSLEPTLTRAQAILETAILPIEHQVLISGFAASQKELENARRIVRKAGLFCPQLPKEIGGLGLSNLEHGLLSQVLGQSPIGHYCFGCQAPDAGNMEILHKFGSSEQKTRFLEPLVRGEIRSCFAMTEPEHAGSNPTEMSTTAVLDGDHYVIDGHKWFTTAADGASFVVVMAVTDPKADRHQRASQIIVPTDTPGFQLVRNIPIMGHEGDGWASHSEIRFEGCRVPVTNRLGDAGSGFTIAQDRLGPGRIHHCMRWIGICERAFSMMCTRASTRELSPGKPLGGKQLIKSWIAEARAEINAARLMVLDAAWKIDKGGLKAARREISLIKFYVADVMMRVVDRAIQVHGALGITSDTVLSWFYVHERGARIYDGPDEVHKMVVAKSVMKEFLAK